MRGSVMRRGSGWTYVVYLGRDAQGPQQQRWKGGFATKRAAEDALTEVLEKVRTGAYADAGRTTVAEFLEQWLAAASPGLRRSTAASYTDVLTGWVIPRLGHVKLSALTPVRISALRAELLATGRRDGKGGLSTAR